MPSPISFLIVHGAYGSPQGNWFPWIQKELKKVGNVIAPVFPTPEGQSLEAWLNTASKALANTEPQNTILIGHSTGAILVLHMAEQTKQPFRAVYSICPFDRDLDLPQFDPLNTSFITPPFDGKAVGRGSEKITCFAGDNDPYVPLAYTQEVAEKVGAELIVAEKGGHLNAESGYYKFPLLLQEIHKDLSS